MCNLNPIILHSTLNVSDKSAPVRCAPCQSKQDALAKRDKLDVHIDVTSQNNSVSHLHLSDLDDSDNSEFRPEEDMEHQVSEEQEEGFEENRSRCGAAVGTRS